MKSKQAKDFLVQQVAEQASRENVPLSEIEKQMMYFTESDPASCQNPTELNAQFEAECDTAEYEAKMSRLLHHAYDRLKQENPVGKQTWDDAIRALRKGDHYLLVLWDIKPPGERRKGDSLKLVGAALLVAVALVAIAFAAAKYNINIHDYRVYIYVALIVIVFLAKGGFRIIYNLFAARFDGDRTKDDKSN